MHAPQLLRKRAKKKNRPRLETENCTTLMVEKKTNLEKWIEELRVNTGVAFLQKTNLIRTAVP